jgi:hypothetical protein
MPEIRIDITIQQKPPADAEGSKNDCRIPAGMVSEMGTRPAGCFSLARSAGSMGAHLPRSYPERAKSGLGERAECVGVLPQGEVPFAPERRYGGREGPSMKRYRPEAATWQALLRRCGALGGCLPSVCVPRWGVPGGTHRGWSLRSGVTLTRTCHFCQSTPCEGVLQCLRLVRARETFGA